MRDLRACDTIDLDHLLQLRRPLRTCLGKPQQQPQNGLHTTDGLFSHEFPKMTKCFHIIVALAFVLTGCASILPGKDKAQTQVTKNKVPPGYIKAPRGEPPYRLRSIRLFGSGDSGDSTKPSGPQVYDPDYAEYLEWKRWQEFKAYQEWKAKKESQAQGS